ncbi:MAG: NUDIX hydrolase, partial [Clostridium sp.]
MEKTEQKNGKTPGEGTPVERLNRELKYQGTILKVYEDTVKVRGHEAKWDFIHHDGAAAVVAVTEEGKLLMVRQYRNALDRYTLEIPAGKLDAPDEPKIQCAYRELEEETGFRADHLEYLLSINTTIAFCDEALDVFLARDLKPSSQNLDPDEEIQVEEWELSDLLDLIYTGKMT